MSHPVLWKQAIHCLRNSGSVKIKSEFHPPLERVVDNFQFFCYLNRVPGAYQDCDFMIPQLLLKSTG